MLPLCTAISYAQTADDITDLLLITGQSNVQGSQTAYDPALDTTDSRVFAYTSNGTWEVADLHQAWDVNNWHPGNGSIADPSRQPYNHFGFHAAKTIVQQDPSRVVGIVVASAPGEGIKHWDTCGAFFTEVSDKAQAALSAQSGKTRFDGILWHQGETDWQTSGTSDVDASADEKAYDDYYPEKLANLMQNFRDQSWFGANRPFICGETSQAPVNQRLNELNSDASDWTACVAGSDLSTRDGTHFDANGLRELGKRYGEEYLQIQNTATTDTSQPDVAITSPPVDGTTQDHYAVYAGTTSDTGGGVNMVRAAILDNNSGQWFNFIDETFSDCFSSIRTDLSEQGAESAQWSMGVELPGGNYTLSVQASDTAGNSK
ncbi:MAG: sialate O-acetylesterase [Pseudomonadota bacterium]